MPKYNFLSNKSKYVHGYFMQIIVFHPCSEAALVPCCYNWELIFIFYYKYFTHLVSHFFFTIDVISKGIINVHLNKTSFF